MKLVYTVLIVFVLGALVSIGGNYYIKYRYEINPAITKEALDQIYGKYIEEVVSLYRLENDEEIAARLETLKSKLPRDKGILSLSQRDKGIKYYSYGTKYFYYEKEPYAQSYYYTNGSLRSVLGLIRGYVKNGSGVKVDTVKYKVVYRNGEEELDILLTIDYEKLVELVNAL